MSLSPEKSVFEYDVRFNPEVDSLKLRNEMLNGQKEIIGPVKSFDGIRMWLPFLLGQKKTTTITTNRLTNESVTITITFQNKTSMSNSVQLYNVLFNRAMKHLDMVRVRRNFYLKSQAITIPQHSLEIWPGYVTAAHHMKGGVMLCVDVSHKILKTDTIHQIMRDILQSSHGTYEHGIKEQLLGKIVLTRYNNKTYRIDDIDFTQNPTSTFTTSRGEISYVDYYKRSYDITIKDLKQPMLVNKAKKYDSKGEAEDTLLSLVPELCYATGLTDEMRADFRIMKDVAEHTRITPQNRVASLFRFVNGINKTPAAKQVLADWGITLCESVVHPSGRVLPPEAIIFGNKKIPGSENADWGRECVRERVINPVPLNAGEWAVIYFQRNAPAANKFMSTYRQICGALGIEVGRPIIDELSRDNIEAYTSSIKLCHSKNVKMIVIIFPSQREDRYSAVKRLACSDLGVATQCINHRTIMNDNKLRSVTQKIALQINCKMGGELWAVHIPSTEFMVCGIDVYHDPSRRNNSVVGWVSSTNPGLTRWKSHVTTQGKGQEISDSLMVSLRIGLKAYFKENNKFPQKVVIFRDGVGDGMLKITEEHEVRQMTTVFNEIPNYEPEFYFIVVQKRINTRIFKETNNKFENPVPGSVVDNVITKRNMFDFLLVSQNVRQGTVSPTYFIILKCHGVLSPDNLQKLSYKMTHMYYNWPGTVRVPAPCLYAHKVAYLVGQNVKKAVDPSLTDRLYFL